jgi:hydrogenase nickel incorporation protein HypB
MFRAADLMLVTKTDLLEVLDDFEPERAEHNLRNLASTAPVITLSSRKELGMDSWLKWLDNQVEEQRQRVSQGETRKPAIQPDGVELHNHGTQSERPHIHVQG